MSSKMLTKDFSEDEMKCPCCGVCNMDDNFMAHLQTFRDLWGKPIIVTSGSRCRKHNLEVDGVPGSQHLVDNGRKCCASDIAVSPLDRYEFVKLAFQVGFKGIGIGKNFIHVDTREGDVNLWKY